MWHRKRAESAEPLSIDLPEFAYHPDPVATGSVVASDAMCIACGDARGFMYTGPVYAAEEIVDELCPWCIADGSAAATFDAAFTDVGSDVPDDVPADVRDVIAHRTPGYQAWQQARWLYHCADGAAFLGRVDRAELERYPEALRAEIAGWDAKAVERHDTDGQPTAYLFRCRHCGTHLAYSDFT
jgi:uncharacterized protein CbrC (UPF0167 family)